MKLGRASDSRHSKNCYTEESVGIAAGFFIAAVHAMGLVTLTRTPNPMNLSRDLLGRGTNEQVVLELPVGRPADDAKVPDLQRLPGNAFIQWNIRHDR